MRAFIYSLLAVSLASCKSTLDIGSKVDIGFCYWPIPPGFILRKHDQLGHSFYKPAMTKVRNVDGFWVDFPVSQGDISIEMKGREGANKGEWSSTESYELALLRKGDGYKVYKITSLLESLNDDAAPFVMYGFETHDAIVSLANLSFEDVDDMINFCLRNRI